MSTDNKIAEQELVALDISLEVPAELDEKEAKEILKRIFIHADRIHRAAGGSGLTATKAWSYLNEEDNDE